MPEQEALTLRALGSADLGAVHRILNTSEYIHYRFELGDLPHLLDTCPSAGLFSVPAGPLARAGGGSLRAFLLTNWIAPPNAWIGGFGVAWSEGSRFEHFLDPLLAEIARLVAARGARTLYYSGGDVENDWLRASLEARGFHLVSLLRSYDKFDFGVPSPGDARVRVRPFTSADLPALLEIERQAFPLLWQHDAASFAEIARSYPYFVVAELAGRVVGYQFNTLDAATGYLVRIAVDPRAEGQGIGTRLLAEAVRYFQRQHVVRIALNSEDQHARPRALRVVRLRARATARVCAGARD